MEKNVNSSTPCFYVSSMFRVRDIDKFLDLMKEVVSDEPISVREHKIHGEEVPYVEFSCPGKIYGLPGAPVGSITYKNGPESWNVSEAVFARSEDLVTAAKLACEEGKRITVALVKYKEGTILDTKELSQLNKSLVKIRYDNCQDVSAHDWDARSGGEESHYSFSHFIDALRFHVHPEDAIVLNEAKYGIGDADLCAHVITYKERDSASGHTGYIGQKIARKLLHNDYYCAISNWRDCDSVVLM